MYVFTIQRSSRAFHSLTILHILHSSSRPHSFAPGYDGPAFYIPLILIHESVELSVCQSLPTTVLAGQGSRELAESQASAVRDPELRCLLKRKYYVACHCSLNLQIKPSCIPSDWLAARQ